MQPNYFLQPFEIDFWLAVIFSLVIGTSFILIIQFIWRKYVGEVKNPIISNLFIGFEILCNQKGSKDEENVSFRIVKLMFRIIAIFLTASYGADIISFLAIKIPEIPFTNLDEFFKINDYHLIANSDNFQSFIDRVRK